MQKPNARPELDVFLSYSRRDTIATKRLKAALEGAGHRVQIDLTGILAGERWRNRLFRMIEGADVIVFALSEHSLASSVCQEELEHARVHEKRVVVAALEDFDETEVPDWIAELNYVMARDDAEREAIIPKLLQGVTTDPESVRYHSRLLRRARTWDLAGQPPHEMLSGPSLDAAEDFVLRAPDTAPPAGDLVRSYIVASRRHQTNEQEAALQKAEEQAKRERGLRQDAEARAAAARGQMLTEYRYDLACLIAAESWAMRGTRLGQTTLCRLLFSMPRLARILSPINPNAPPGAKALLPKAAAFSPDGKYLATIEGHYREDISFWSLDGEPELMAKAYMADDAHPSTLTFAGASGEYLVVGFDDGTCQVQDPAILGGMPLFQTGEKGPGVSALAAMPERDAVALARGTKVEIWDFQQARVTQILDSDSHTRITRLSFMAGGTHLLVAGDIDGAFTNDPEDQLEQAGVLDVERGIWLRQDQGIAQPLWSGDGYYLTRKRVYDVTCHKTETGYDAVGHFRNYDQPTRYAIGNADREIAFLEDMSVAFEPAHAGAMPRYKQVREPDPGVIHGWYADTIVSAPPTCRFGYVSAAPDGSAALWTKNSASNSRWLAPPQTWAETATHASIDLSYSNDGTRLAALSSQGHLCIWNLRDDSAQHLRELPPIIAISATDDGFLLGSRAGHVFELGPKGLTRAGEGFLEGVSPRSVPYGLLGRTTQGDLGLFRAPATGIETLGAWPDVLPDEAGALSSIGLNLTGYTLAAPNAQNNEIVFYSRKHGALSRQKAVQTTVHNARVDFVPHRPIAVVAGCETLELWNIQRMERLAAYGTGSGVGADWRVAVDPTDRFLAGKGQYGKSIAIFDGANAMLLAFINDIGARNDSNVMAFSPDGKTLAVDDGAEGVRLIDFDPDTWAATLRQRAGRPLTDTERTLFLGS